EAIGVEVDDIRLRSEGNESWLPLGRLQSFRQEDGERDLRRVSHGAITVAPRSEQVVQLEYEGVERQTGYVVQIPVIYRLSIQGQIMLPGLLLPLSVEQSRVPSNNERRDAFVDPFAH